MATETEFRTTLEHTIEKYRQVLEQFPYESSAQLALAELTQLRGLRLEALLSHQAILKVAPVPESRVALADVYASQGLYNQAFEEISATLAQFPIFPEAHYYAVEFSETVPLPEELKQALERPCHQPDLARAFLQVGLKRSVILRELQELSQVSERAKGEPLAVYRVEETRKRLLLLERRLVRIEQLEAQRVVRETEAERLKVLEQERLRQLQELQQATPVELGHEVNGASSGWEDVVAEPRPTPAAAVEEVALPVEEISPVADIAGEAPSEDVVIEYETSSPSESVAAESSEVHALRDLVPALETAPPLHNEVGLGDDLMDLSFETENSFEVPPEATWSEPEIAIGETFESVHSDMGADLGDEEGLSIDLHFAEPEELSVEEQLETLRNSESGEGYLAVPTEILKPVYVPPVLEIVEVPKAPLDLVALAPTPAAPTLTVPVSITSVGPAFASEKAHDCAITVDRGARYAKKQGEISGLIAILAKTRGVTSIHVVARDGYLVDQSSRDAMPVERVSEFVVEGLGILEGFAPEPKYWVLECSGGIVVFQVIDARHVLLAIGQAGANFGALRYTMDKMRPQFGLILGAVDE